MHLAGLAGLDDEPDAGAGLLADQVVVHGCGRQQHRDRRQVLIGVPVRQDDDVHAVLDRLADLAADALERPSQAVAAGERREQRANRACLEARVGLFDVEDLVQADVVEDRVGQLEHVTGPGAGLEDVSLRTDLLADRGHQLLADRVERRVRHLREQLLEVVVEQAGSFGEHGDGRVGAHRAERFHAVAHHRLDDELDLFVGVAEGLLVAEHLPGALGDVHHLGQVVEVTDTCFEPLGVRVRRGEVALDLLVVDDAALGGVDQEHAPRLESSLLHHRRRVDVERADLGGHHHQTVVADPVARRAQTVAVEHRTDDRAVGEGDRGGAVPRLHQTGVELVEGTDRRVHVLVVLPRLGDHHQHRVGQRVAAEVQQLERLVQACGVRGAGRADRERALQRLPSTGEQLGVDEGLAGAHPVLVALDGVDLAVVGDVAVGVRERPRREGVGREPRVHEGERRLEALVAQVGEELPELRGGEHPLVDHRAGRQRRQVHRCLAGCVDDVVLDALAGEEGASVQHDAGLVALGGGDHELAEGRHRCERRGTDHRGVGGHVTPSENVQALLVTDLLDRSHGCVGLGGIRRQERDAGRVVPGGRAVRRRARPAGTHPAPG